MTAGRDDSPQACGRGVFVTGTDTAIGKTVAAAYLVRALDADYWKPVESGAAPRSSDRDIVRRLAELPENRCHPSAYALAAAASPHEAARREHASISLDRITRPPSARPLVVEGAGGVLVPLNARHYMVDLIASLGLPAVLVARDALGTINHTLLSIEALRRRRVRIAGVILNREPGDSSDHLGNRAAIEQFGGVPVLCELPYFDPLDAAALADFAATHPFSYPAPAAPCRG